MLDAGRLSLIVRAGAGYNTIDVAAASTRGIYVSNCPGKNAIAVAELAFGADPGARSAHPRQRRRAARRHAGTRRSTRRRGACTAGRSACSASAASAQEMIRRAAGFGMNVVIWSRRFDGQDRPLTEQRGARARHRERRCGRCAIELAPTPGDVAARADILSVHLALSPETKGLVNAALLARLEAGRDRSSTPRAARSSITRRSRPRSARSAAARRPRRLRERAGRATARRSRRSRSRCPASTARTTSARRPTRRRRRSPPRPSASSAATRRPAACRTS